MDPIKGLVCIIRAAVLVQYTLPIRCTLLSTRMFFYHVKIYKISVKQADIWNQIL